jgi:hypothetical protein
VLSAVGLVALPEPDWLTEAAEPLVVPHYCRIDPAGQPEVLADPVHRPNVTGVAGP